MTAPVILKGGLDLRRSKPAVVPGRLLDCKNYETTTDVEGYKPVDGFERYDGRMSPSTQDIWQLTIPTADITNSFVVGDRLAVGGVIGTGVEFGVLAVISTSGTDTILTFAYWPGAATLRDGDIIYGSVASFSYRGFNVLNSSGTTFNVIPVVLDSDGNEFTVGATVLNSSGTSFAFMNGSVQHITAYKIVPLTLFTELDTVAGVFRGLISAVPGNGPLLAEKRFEGKTYAVRNYHNIGFDSGTTEPAVYQRILDASGNEGIIHVVETNSGDWGLGTAAGAVTIEAYDPAFAVANNDQLDMVGEIQFSSGSTQPSAGDVISGQTSGSTATVHRVRLDTGTFLGGDAAGIVFIIGESAAFTDGELIDNDTTVATDVLTDDEQTHTSLNNFIAATAVTKNQPKAGMWESSRVGWTRVDLGWEVSYDTGTNAPEMVDLGGTAAEAETSSENTGWVAGLSLLESTDTGYKAAWTGATAAALSADDGTEATWANDSTTSVDLSIYNFPISLKSSDTPLGFELEFRARRSAGSNPGWFGQMIMHLSPVHSYLSPPDKYTSYRNDYPSKPLNTATEFTHVIGSTSDDWGGWLNSNGTITADDILDPDFGFRFAIQSLSSSGGSTYNVDRVRFRVTYLPAGKKVFFWDSTNSKDLGTAIVTHDYISTGSYAGNAVGTLSLADLTRYDFDSGMQIRTATAGGGVLISVTTSAPLMVSMAGSTLLDAESSIYQMMVANFFAADSLNALYGVSGAGLGFVYDGNYFRRIRTGVLEVDDKPRHLGAFQFRLIFGYKWGELSWSVAGAPLSFDGTLNAVATGYGFDITGLRELSGKMFGVFTNGGVFGAVVSGADFEQQILARGSKVVEYSVQEFGDDTVWCDQNGIRNLASTDKYGDFEGGTLSRDVNKWLKPRLRRKPFISPRNGNFVNSTIIRSKGQYRMFFADGEVLTMTWNQVEAPELTLQKLWLDNDESNAFVRVFATSSDTDEDGTEHIYFAVYERPEYDHGADLGYVFQSESGPSFDGDAITAFATVSWLNVGDPVRNKRFTKWQLHGEAYNYATPTIDFAVNLVEPDGTGAETLKIGKTTNSSTLEHKPFFTKSRSKKRGRNIAIRFDHNSATELPHLLQMLVSVDESKGRKEI